MGRVTFTVFGIAQPKGSHTAVVRGGRAVLLNGANQKARDAFAAWEAAVRSAALMQSERLFGELPELWPLAVSVAFYLPRPKSHARMRTPPTWHTTKPDADKLLRAVLDPLTGILVRDDSQFAIAHAEKRYAHDANHIGAVVTITRLPDGD